MNILQAIEDPKLFGPWFSDAWTWHNWRAFLAALFGLPMDEEQQDMFTRCTGRTEPPESRADEGWLICGRRAGKSFILSLIAVYLACFRDYRAHLAPGERATIMIIAADRRQARVILRYVRALLEVPMLAALLERSTKEAFHLSNGVTIEIATASFRTTRGYTLCAALCDELAFWTTEGSAAPDFEVLDALRPGMATIPGSMLLCASSPYARKGALWQAWRAHYGQNGDPVLVWKSATRTMNPTVSQRIIDEACARDPSSAAAEWMAEFRADLEAFVPLEVVEKCVEPGCFERPPERGKRYFGFCDPSGGSNDAMTLAIAHNEGDRVILDALRERRAPFKPSEVVHEFGQLLKQYQCTTVEGDRYAGEWPREQFQKRGITYLPAKKTRTELYVELLPRLNGATIELLKNDRLVHQLVSLERRTTRGGKDSIDHPPGAHDDIANAVAGVAHHAATATRNRVATKTIVGLNW